MEEIYHERQSKELCALHALNNIFQRPNEFTQVIKGSFFCYFDWTYNSILQYIILLAQTMIYLCLGPV